MNIVVFALFLVCVSAAPDWRLKWWSLYTAEQVRNMEQSDDPQKVDYVTEWKDFKIKYGKVYKTSQEEEKRRNIFSENLKMIESHNLLHANGLRSYTLGVNKYADLSQSEFQSMMLGFIKPVNDSETSKASTFLPSLTPVQLPDEVDWREHGYVTPVKNQGRCGSCWAFSTTGSLEGQHFRKTGKLVSLSEQNLVDCDHSIFGNKGCNGGRMERAFQYIHKNNGIDTESSYPYEAKDMSCRFKRADVGATVTGYKLVKPQTEKMLKQATATEGPISVSISAIKTFQHYKDGIYDDPECHNYRLNHAVLVVGYGSNKGHDYWIVKNSWGTDWGMNGYVMMARNDGNLCGIASNAVYPLV